MPPAAQAASRAAAPPTASAVLSDTAEPPPPVAGAPDGTAVGCTAGAVASVVGLLVAYSCDSSLLELPVACSSDALPELPPACSCDSLLELPVDDEPSAGWVPGATATAVAPPLDVEATAVGFDVSLVHGGVWHLDWSAPDVGTAMAMAVAPPLIAVATAEGFGLAATSAEVEPLCMVMPGMSEVEDDPMPGISPGAMFMPDDEDGAAGGEVVPWGIAEEDAAVLGALLAIALAVGDGVTGATVVGTSAASAGGAPAGGAPAPAVEDVESLPALSPIRESTTASSTIATSAPMTQAVLFGLSLSGPDWSSDAVSAGGMSAMMFSRWRAQLVRNATDLRVGPDHGGRKDLVSFHMHQTLTFVTGEP
jgi:hypothetical protein